ARSAHPHALPDGDCRRVASCAACQDNGDLAQITAARCCEWYTSGESPEGRFLAGTPSEPHHHKDTLSPLPSRQYSTSPEQETRQTAEPPDTRERGEGRGRAAWRTWADAHAEVGICPRTSPRVDCLRFLSPRANRPRKFHTATLSYTFQSVSISRTLNTP